MRNNLSFARRTNRRLNNHTWNGFFVDLNYNPDKQYNPSHFCFVWKECCSQNLLLKPNHLLKLEEERGSHLNAKRTKEIEGQFSILKKILIDKLEKQVETKTDIQMLINMMRSFSWVCSEFGRISF